MASDFIGITAKKVQKLRDADPAVAAIQSRPLRTSLDWLRESFKHDTGIKGSLDYGKAVLDTVAQLDQYLYTYGKMIQSQWETFLSGVTANGDPVRLVDYGCGQGLAGVMLSDCLGDAFTSKVEDVTLIEPSDVALVRAEAVYRNLLGAARIRCFNATLDELKRSDFSQSSTKTLHLFSNILDIPSFDVSNVFNAALTSGDHILLAVSHNRDFDGGAPRLKAIKEEIDKKKYRNWIKVRTSKVHEFMCGDSGNFAAISWYADLEINRE